MLPVLDPRLVETFRDRLLEADLHLDLIVPRNVSDQLAQHHPNVYQESLHCDQFIIGLYSREVPFGLFLGEDTVGLAGYDDNNFLRCVAENHSAAAHEWGETVFREFEGSIESHIVQSKLCAD